MKLRNRIVLYICLIIIFLLIKQGLPMFENWINGGNENINNDIAVIDKRYNVDDLQEDEGRFIAQYVYDLNNNKELLNLNADKKVLSASLAKLYNVNFALSVLSPEEAIRVGSEIELAPNYASVAGINYGNYKIKEIIKAVIIPSGADAAYALAKATIDKIDNKDYENDKIVEIYNKKINEFNKDKFPSTTISDPAGLSFDTITSAKDIANVIKDLLKYDFMREIFSTYEINIYDENGNSYYVKNTNKFLDKNGTYYNPNVIGIKTGSLKDLYNIVIRYKSGDKDLLIISLNNINDEGRYSSSKALIDKFK